MRDLASDGNIKNEGGCEVLGIGQQQTAGRLFYLLDLFLFKFARAQRPQSPSGRRDKKKEKK